MIKLLAKKIKSIGPGALVTAAFIGPGTLTTCIRAGVENGYSLLWAVIFSTISAIILHEMSSRIGIITGKGLGENIHDRYNKSISRLLAVTLVFSSIFIGNSAFEEGV